MGMQSTIMIMNDGLHKIEDNPVEFVQQMAAMIQHGGGKIDGFSAEVVVVHHNSSVAVTAVGGNTAKVLGYCHANDGDVRQDLDILKALASKHGFSLRKRPTPSVSSLQRPQWRKVQNHDEGWLLEVRDDSYETDDHSPEYAVNGWKPLVALWHVGILLWRATLLSDHIRRDYQSLRNAKIFSEKRAGVMKKPRTVDFL